MCLDQCFSEQQKKSAYSERPMSYTTTSCLNCLKTKIHCKRQQLGNESGKGKKLPCLMSLNLWSDGYSYNYCLLIICRHTLPCCIFVQRTHCVQCNNKCIIWKKRSAQCNNICIWSYSTPQVVCFILQPIGSMGLSLTDQAWFQRPCFNVWEKANIIDFANAGNTSAIPLQIDIC